LKNILNKEGKNVGKEKEMLERKIEFNNDHVKKVNQ
jgi:hypothetical protein